MLIHYFIHTIHKNVRKKKDAVSLKSGASEFNTAERSQENSELENDLIWS